MLPSPARLRSSADFRATVRKGVTAGRDTLVVHMRCAEPSMTPLGNPRVGFVVSRPSAMPSHATASSASCATSQQICWRKPLTACRSSCGPCRARQTTKSNWVPT